jgi:hypothetical protein
MKLMDSGWELQIDVDAVLRGQGANPAVIRKRSPRLVQMALKVLQEGRSLLEPQVYTNLYEVKALRHERLILTGDGYLSGSLVAQHLSPAQKIVVLICTVGAAINDLVSQTSSQNMVYALALDGLGSAAVEALAHEACHHLEMEFIKDGLQASIPLSPGMIGWSVEDGQSQIFSLIDNDAIGVTLNDQFVMTPRKSLSMVVGLGPNMGYRGKVCDYCSMRETCRYQNHYEGIS